MLRFQTGGSFGSNPLHVHVGLGAAERIERLSVWWPTSGIRQVFEDVTADRFLEIREGSDELVELPRRVVEAVGCHHDPTAIGDPARDPTMAAYVAHALISGEPVDELYLARAGCADRLARWRTLATEVNAAP